MEMDYQVADAFGQMRFLYNPYKMFGLNAEQREQVTSLIWQAVVEDDKVVQDWIAQGGKWLMIATYPQFAYRAKRLGLEIRHSGHGPFMCANREYAIMGANRLTTRVLVPAQSRGRRDLINVAYQHRLEVFKEYYT